MRNILLIIVFLFTIQISFSNNRDEVLNKARTFATNKNYNDAIKQYINYIKLFKNEAVNLKEIYFEVANCYYNNKNNFMAVKVIKETITKYGATKEELETSEVLDKKLFEAAWADIFLEYTSLRKQFVNNLNNVDLYVENNKVEIKE